MATTEYIKTPAIKFLQGKYEYYMTSLSSQKLFDVSFISRRSEDKKEGFQRLLNPARAKLITKYYKEGGAIPSPIITSLKKEAHFEYKNGELVMELNETSLMVLDGQHRLYGLNDLDYPIDVPVVIFVGLALDEEAKLFIDINTNQKGVPSALLLDIKSIAKTEDEIEKRQSKLFEFLNIQDPLKDKLLSGESRRGGISRVAFNEITKSIFERGVLSNEADNVIQKAVQNYLLAFQMVFSEANQENADLAKTTIFKAVFGIFDEVLNKTLSIEGNAKVESYYDSIQMIGNIDFSQYSGTNKQTQSRLEEEMRKYLHKSALTRFSTEDLF